MSFMPTDPHFRPTPLKPERRSRPPITWRGRPGEPTPLWAILGGDPPYDYHPGMALSPADGGEPVPTPRVEPARPAPRKTKRGTPAGGMDAGPAVFRDGTTWSAPDPAIDPFQAGSRDTIFPLDWVRHSPVPYTTEGLNNLAALARAAGEPGIYVTAHPAVGPNAPYGTGPDHTAVEYIARDGSRHWISGGPKVQLKNPLTNHLDFLDVKLVTGVGSQAPSGTANRIRPNDTPANNMTMGRVIPPSGMDDATFFQRLKAVAASYDGQAPYGLFPEHMGGVNSNSVVPTLLDRAGGWSTFDFGGTAGGSRRIPDYHFDPAAPGATPTGTYYRDIANWAWRLANPAHGSPPR